MLNNLKKIKLLPVLIFSMVMALVSCEDADVPSGEKTPVKMVIRTNTMLPKAGMVESLQIDRFLINIDEIEFDLDDDYNGNFDDDDITIYGPFLVDLMNAQDGITIASDQIPNAVYDEIEVDVDVSRDSNEPMITNRSVYISGTMNQVPFTFWYDEDFDFEIELPESQEMTFTGESVTVMIEMQLPALLQTLGSSLAGAQDGNGDGTIEISPVDQDGNNDLPEDIMDDIEDALEVEYDDDDDDDDDDDYDDDDNDDDDDDDDK